MGRGGGGHARPGRRATAEPGAGRPGRGGAAGRAASAGGARPGSAEEERGHRRPRPPARNSSPKVAAREARAPGGRGAGGGGGDAASRPGAESAGGGGGMGTRQTKGSLAERASPGAAPGPRRERPDFWASLLLRAGDKAGRAGAGAGLPPYHRRVGMVQELLRMVRQGRREEAGTMLQHLRQVSAGRGRGGAPPLPAEAPERRGAPPGPLLAGMEPGLAAGASALPLNSRPQGRAEEKAGPVRPGCGGPVGIMSPLQSSAGRGGGWSRGRFAGGDACLGRGAFLPLYPPAVTPVKGPQGMRSRQLPQGASKGAALGLVRCQSPGALPTREASWMRGVPDGGSGGRQGFLSRD